MKRGMKMRNRLNSRMMESSRKRVRTMKKEKKEKIS